MRYLGSLFIGADQPGWESDSSSVKPEGGMVVQYLMGSPSVSPSEEGLRDVLVTQCLWCSVFQCFTDPPAPASQLNGCSHTGIPHWSSQESRLSNYPLCFIQKKGDCQPEIFPETVFLESDLRCFIALPVLHPAPSPRMVSSSIFTQWRWTTGYLGAHPLHFLNISVRMSHRVV